MSTEDNDSIEQVLAARQAVADGYETLGVTVMGSRRSSDGYGPEQSVTLRLYRCKTCAALVGDEEWADARSEHAAWHARETR